MAESFLLSCYRKKKFCRRPETETDLLPETEDEKPEIEDEEPEEEEGTAFLNLTVLKEQNHYKFVMRKY